MEEGVEGSGEGVGVGLDYSGSAGELELLRRKGLGEAGWKLPDLTGDGLLDGSSSSAGVWVIRWAVLEEVGGERWPLVALVRTRRRRCGEASEQPNRGGNATWGLVSIWILWGRDCRSNSRRF